MKKILGSLLALLIGIGVQSSVWAHEYNPYQEIYRQTAEQEMIPGKVQFVYVLKNEDGAALAGATLKYLDYDGKEYSIAADAEGMVRLVFLQGSPFVQLRDLQLGEQLLPIVGKTAAGAERKDFKEGTVDYFVLQKDLQHTVVHAYDAD